jgi:hypothetical protein
VEIAVEGLPAHPRWPRYLALGLAALVVIVGVWALASGESADDRDEKQLRAERAERFGELVALERQLVTKSGPDEALLDRRAQLLDEIVELDLAVEATSATSQTGPTGEPDETVSAGARASAVQ